jgi:hypothetical protein
MWPFNTGDCMGRLTVCYRNVLFSGQCTVILK